MVIWSFSKWFFWLNVTHFTIRFIIYGHRFLFIFINIIQNLFLYIFFLYPKRTLLLLYSIFREWRFVLNLRQFICTFFLLLSWRVRDNTLFIYLHKFNKFMNRMRALWIKIFILLHIFHLLMQFKHQWYKLFLICLLILIKFDDAFLHDIEQWVYTMIIWLLLKASGKTRINWHF